MKITSALLALSLISISVASFADDFCGTRQRHIPLALDLAYEYSHMGNGASLLITTLSGFKKKGAVAAGLTDAVNSGDSEEADKVVAFLKDKTIDSGTPVTLTLVNGSTVLNVGGQQQIFSAKLFPTVTSFIEKKILSGEDGSAKAASCTK